MKKLYLHIGMEKTGSTSIQESLYINRDYLLDQGVATLECGGLKNNRKFSLYALEKGAYDDYFIENNILTEEQRDNFDKSIETDFDLEMSLLPQNVETVIISSEHLHSRLRKTSEIARLHTLLSKYFDEIEIICYVREQSLVAASWYSTIVKSGNIRYKNRIPKFSDYLKIWCKSENHYFNYYNILAKWSGVFGKDNINVRLFDRESFTNSSLIDDFYFSAGGLPAEGLEAISPKNESLSNLGLLLGRVLNDIFPRFTPYSGIRYRLMNVLEVAFKGKPKLIDKQVYDTLYKHFENDNLKLSTEYFGVSENVFKYKPPKDN